MLGREASLGHQLIGGATLTCASDVPWQMQMKCSRCGAVFWFDNLAWLWIDNGGYPPIALSADYDTARKSGALIVGNPDTVRSELTAQADRCGYNYLVMLMAFGSLTHAQEMHSLELFHREVGPALASLRTTEAVRRIA